MKNAEKYNDELLKTCLWCKSYTICNRRKDWGVYILFKNKM